MSTDFENIHGDVLLVMVADPLVQYVAQRNTHWEDIRDSLTPTQRYFYAFYHADEVISHTGFLPFFYMGRGEVFDDLRQCLLHIQDKEMENIVIRAVREIEEPKTWKIFTDLKDKLDENQFPAELHADDRIKSIFEPLHELYKQRRPVTMERIEQLVRRHKAEFVKLR